jgi:hypothetical protein
MFLLILVHCPSGHWNNCLTRAGFIDETSSYPEPVRASVSVPVAFINWLLAEGMTSEH